MKKKTLLTVSLMLLLLPSLVAQTATAPGVGDGTVGNPYQINSLDNLYWISQNIAEWDKHYIQTDDIYANETNTWDVGDHDLNAGTPDEAMGFSSIGYFGNPFTGTYNGQMHQINGLYINRLTADDVGLFGLTANARIDSLQLYVNITGGASVGGLVGNCYTGTTITCCFVGGIVTGVSNYVGGLIGRNFGVLISQCYNSATIHGVGSVGGLIGGALQGEVSNCYSVGSVYGTGSGIGGFIGNNNALSTVSNSFCSVVPVSGGTDVGGFMGLNTGTVSNCFWDTYWGQPTSAGGSPRDHVEMKTISTYTDSTWDFAYETINGTNDYWLIPCGGDNYPRLTWQDNSIFAATGTDTRIECSAFVWIDGNTYSTDNNTAMFTLVNGSVNGCDSIVTLNLTMISPPDIATTTSGITITATNASASYKWLDCGNNYAVIAGETGQSFTATANGNYAVQVTENNCVDTSLCVAITTVAIQETAFGANFTVYPNPTNGDFSIDLGSEMNSVVVSITDVRGQFIQSQTYSQAQLLKFTLVEPAGVYILSIQTGDYNSVIRLVKN